MRLPDKVKIILVLFSGLIFFISGCVDTGVQVITPTTYYSQFQVVNLAAVSGATTLNIYNADKSLAANAGTLNLGDVYPSSSFMQIPSGQKKFVFASNDTIPIFIDTERRIRVFVLNLDTTTAKTLDKQDMRYIFASPGTDNGKTIFPKDTGQVALFNGSPDAMLNGITLTGPDTVDVSFDSPLAIGGSTGYTFLSPGDYSVDVTYNDSLHTTFSQTVGALHRYTVVIYGNAASLNQKVLTDD